MSDQVLAILAIVAIVISGLAAIVSGVSILLHLIGPHTKTKVDDNLAAGADKILAELKALGALVASALGKTGGAIVLIVAISVIAGCGPSARQKEIATTFAALNAGASAWQRYDIDHQRTLYKQASTKEEAVKLVGEWRDGPQSTVNGYLIDALKALSAAQMVNDNPSLQTLANAASLFTTELHKLGVL